MRHSARYCPRPRDPERVIGLVGPGAKADSRIKAPSGGRRRRLDVALGVIGGPALLLLEEPTTGFDPTARRRWVLTVDSPMNSRRPISPLVQPSATCRSTAVSRSPGRTGAGAPAWRGAGGPGGRPHGSGTSALRHGLLD